MNATCAKCGGAATEITRIRRSGVVERWGTKCDGCHRYEYRCGCVPVPEPEHVHAFRARRGESFACACGRLNTDAEPVTA